MATNQMFKWLSFCLSAVLILGLSAFLSRNHWLPGTRSEMASQKPKEKPIQNEAEDSIQMVIHGRLAEVQECYNSQLKRGLNRSGKLVVTWFVNNDGQPSQFEEELNELGSAELYDCTTTAIQAWPFPKNRATQIRYTFKMKDLEKEKLIHEITAASEVTEAQTGRN